MKRRPYLLSAMLLAAALGAQIPVDLRPPPAVPPPRVVRPPAPDYDPRYEFVALRWVLDDLWERQRALLGEAGELSRDAGLLWDFWRSLFGVRGGFADLGVFSRRSAPPSELSLQASVFALDGSARRLAQDADQTGAGLQEAEILHRGVTARMRRGPRAQERVELKESLGRLRSRLAESAARINALDAGIAGGQGDFDDLYGRVSRALERAAPESPAPPRPGHWDYMLSGQPRPALRYDFETALRGHLARAEEELD